MSLRAGLDFGGTSVKIGLVSDDGRLAARTLVAVAGERDFDALVGRVAVALDGLVSMAGTAVAGIGISAPGYADPQTGALVDGANNIPALGGGRSLTVELGRRYRVPSRIDNDGTCAALGELRFGAGRGLRNFVVMTLGTGIGGGVVIDGRPVLGPGGIPPEIGAICLDPDGPANYSGIAGTFEHLACAGSVVDRYRKAGGGAANSAVEVFTRQAHGDPAAEAAVEGVALAIAQACGILVNLLNLEACILGGGMSASAALIDRVRGHLPAFTWPLLARKTSVRAARLGNDAGMIGAVVLLETNG